MCGNREERNGRELRRFVSRPPGGGERTELSANPGRAVIGRLLALHRKGNARKGGKGGRHVIL